MIWKIRWWQDSNPGQQFKHFSSAPFNLFDWSWASKRAKLFEGAYWKENMLSKRLARRKQLFDKAPIASDRKHVQFFNINVIEQKALTVECNGQLLELIDTFSS